MLRIFQIALLLSSLHFNCLVSPVALGGDSKTQDLNFPELFFVQDRTWLRVEEIVGRIHISRWSFVGKRDQSFGLQGDFDLQPYLTPEFKDKKIVVKDILINRETKEMYVLLMIGRGVHATSGNYLQSQRPSTDLALLKFDATGKRVDRNFGDEGTKMLSVAFEPDCFARILRKTNGEIFIAGGYRFNHLSSGFVIGLNERGELLSGFGSRGYVELMIDAHDAYTVLQKPLLLPSGNIHFTGTSELNTAHKKATLTISRVIITTDVGRYIKRTVAEIPGLNEAAVPAVLYFPQQQAFLLFSTHGLFQKTNFILYRTTGSGGYVRDSDFKQLTINCLGMGCKADIDEKGFVVVSPTKQADRANLQYVGWDGNVKVNAEIYIGGKKPPCQDL